MDRRLAAILAADMVGYSRAMQADEAGTLAALNRFRSETIEPLLAEHRGRIVKLMGDGVLAEFGSVVDAVACAAAWQERAAGGPLQFRIGVNLGDIIIEGEDIFGSGVNIAARLETLAPPGGICISDIVHGEVRQRLKLAFEDLGPQTFKNIEGPVRAWRIAPPASQATPSQPAQKSADDLSEKPSVAVLPFANMSGDPEQEYFSDGITEDIITEVSRFRELFVTARNSSFAFKGQNPDIRTVGEKLGVQFAVEGSVRRAGNRVRVTAQLIETATGNHVWAERYDRDLADIFEVQDELAHAVASRVADKVRSRVAERARRRPTENMTAYDHYLRGISAHKNYVLNPALVEHLEKAVAIDPDFAAAHAGLAMMLTFKFILDHDPATKELALAHAQKSLQLDPNDSRCQTAMGYALIFSNRLEEGKAFVDKSVAMNPNDAWTRGISAYACIYFGRFDDAIAEIDVALKLDPFDHDWFWDVRGIALMQKECFAEAVDAFRRLNRQAPWTLVWNAICLAKLGRVDEARRAMAQYREIEPDRTFNVFRLIDDEPYADPAMRDRLKAILLEFGMVDAAGNSVPAG
jgi:adenylate cyclase